MYFKLYPRYKYEDIADEYDIENTEPLESSNPHRDYPNPKYRYAYHLSY